MERWLLAVFFVVYFTTAFVWRSWQVWRKTGVNPYVLPHSDDAQGYVAKAFRLVLLTMAAYVAVQAAWPDADSSLPQIDWLVAGAIRLAGWCTLLASLMWVMLAQMQMGTSWRIGIDVKNETALVRNGLFALSRNPIFLAMRASLLGLLLVRPNALTLVLAVAGELLMQMQVRQEEDFLRQRHGAAYLDYCAHTPRWI
ncbi:methyltransferase family protein [Noviherbaspirillum sp. ST9]|uniref:methyltransferase family protein n=1 Tax=Noviherbaspirillum sp. ST9 TaxID=3401606 RepID=UPI003B58B265